MDRPLVLAAALFAVLAGTAGAAVPPIVFSSDRSPDLDVVHRYSIDPSGADRRELAQQDGVVSPDGRLVARVGGTAVAPTIEVAPVAGGARRTVVTGFPEEPGIVPGRPSLFWAPSSRLLAVLVPRTCTVPPCYGNDIWTVRVDGSALIRVASGRRPVWSPDSRRLAFVRYYDRFSSDAVFVVRADGGGERAVAAGTLPVWAPRGHVIAYAARRGLAVVDPDRRASRRMLAFGNVNGLPAWSPDARHVVAVLNPRSTRSRSQILVTGDARTGRSRIIVRGASTGTPVLLPAFSPDGKRLAYVTSTPTSGEQVFTIDPSGRSAARQVTTELPWSSFSSLTWTRGGGLVYEVSQWHADRELWAVQPDGSGLTQLTDNLFEDFAPAWSPDSTRIVFERSNAYVPLPTTDKPGLYLLDPATGTQRFLLPLASDDFEAAPAWSPDGSTIALILSNTVALIGPDGTLIRSMQTLGRPRHPTWSPDGARIAFSDSAPAHLSELYVMGRDGSALTQITDFQYAALPAWSPDGRWLAFYGQRTDGTPPAIWIARPDGSDARLVARLPTAGAVAAAWSPDSARILYSTQTLSSESSELHIVALDGSGDTIVAAARGANEMPSWRR